jgi:hypothetical protein
MPIRCPTCGRDNRDTASFCAGCGRRDLQVLALQMRPALQHPDLLAPPAPAVLAPQTPAPLASQPPAALPSRASRRAGWLRRQHPILQGVIDSYNQDEVYPPNDLALALARVGIAAAILPAALSFFAGLGVLLIVIIVLGGGIILAIFGALIGAFAKLFSLLVPRRRPGDRKLTQVSLIVQEHGGGQDAVLLYGDHIAGMLHKGELVEIYGRRDRSGVVRAARVEVVGVQFAAGAVARRVVKGKRGFPIAVTIGVWAAALVAWGVFYMPTIMRILH